MSKGEGRKIAIKFTEDLTNDFTYNNVPAFTVEGQEYDMVPGGVIIEKDYPLISVERRPVEILFEDDFETGELLDVEFKENKLKLKHTVESAILEHPPTIQEYSLVFDGAGRVIVPSGVSASLENKSKAILKGYFKRGATNVRETMFGLSISGNTGKFEFYFNTDNQIQLGGRSQHSDSWQAKASTETFTDTNTHKFEAWLDIANDTARVWVDDVELNMTGTTSWTRTTFTNQTGTNQTIGCRPALDLNFTGTLDNLEFFGDTTLIGKWFFDTQNSHIVRDESVNNYDGEINSLVNVKYVESLTAPVKDVPELPENEYSLKFNGSGYVTLPSSVSSALDGKKKATLKGYFRRETTGVRETIFGLSVSGGFTKFELFFDVDDTIIVGARSQAGDSWQQLVSTTTITDANIHKFEAVIDIENNTGSIFIDDVELTLTGTLSWVRTTFTGEFGTNQVIGARVALDAGFTGFIDNLELYGEDVCIGRWQFNKLEEVNDISGNSNHGTISSTTNVTHEEPLQILYSDYETSEYKSNGFRTLFLALFLLPEDEKRIMWQEEVITDTTIKIETGVNESNIIPPETWVEQTNGEQITNIPEGDLTEKYLWIKQTLSTTNIEVTPVLESLWLEVADQPQNKILLTIENQERFNMTEGDLTVSYDATLGNLAGTSGPVESFSHTFTPQDLNGVPRNINDPETVGFDIDLPVFNFIKIDYTDEDSHEETVGFDVQFPTFALIHIDNIEV